MSLPNIQIFKAFSLRLIAGILIMFVNTGCSSKNNQYSSLSSENTYTVKTVSSSSKSRDKAKYHMTNVEEMKNSNIPIGAKVTTSGFYSANDNGGANYSISAAPMYPLDANISIALNNGLFANLIFNDSSIINIQTFGITKNGYISSALNKVTPVLTGNIGGIKFPDGKYYIDKPIKLYTVNLYGTDNSQIIIDKNYASDCFACIQTDTEVSNKLGFYNLHLVANIDNGFERKGETVLVYLRNIEKCTIDNCTFEANESSDIKNFIPIDLIWFQTNNAQNITVTNSTFNNNTGVNFQPGTNPALAGGCLWFSGTEKTIHENHMSDITIENCEFFNAVRDEHMALWNGLFNNVILNNCTFSNSSNHTSDNFLSFYRGTFNNINISNVDMTFNSSTMYPIKFTDFISESDFTVKNLDMIFDFKEESDPYHHSFSIFYIDEDQQVDNDIPVKISISDSQFMSTSDFVWYNSIIQCKHTAHKDITIQNCISNIRYELTALNIEPDNTVTEKGFFHN